MARLRAATAMDARGLAPLEQLGMFPGGADQPDDVGQHFLVDKHLVHKLPQIGQLPVIHDLAHLGKPFAFLLSAKKLNLVLGGGIAQGQAQGKTVQLAVRQQLCA